MPDHLNKWRNRSPGDLRVELEEITTTPVEPRIDQAAQGQLTWSHVPLEQRIQLLRQIQSELKQASPEFAKAISLEIGKPLRESRGEMAALITKFDFAIGDAESFLKPVSISDAPHPSQVRHLPRGIAAIIGPFNFPLHLPNGAILAYLLAGNSVVFKPSPAAAVVAKKYTDIFQRYLPVGVFELVQGGANEAIKLCLDPRIRSICFTGSISAGQKLSKALAGDFSKNVALELGGKNAAIICRDADLEIAAKAVAEGACLTAGQRCNSTSRVIVDRVVANSFINHFVRGIESFVPGNPLDERTRLGPLINETAVQRFTQMLEETNGEWIVRGGVQPTVDERPGYFVRPAAIVWKNHDDGLQSLIHKQEIFAPLVEIYISENDEEALKLHNTLPFGLTASVFTRSKHRFWKFVEELRVGNLYANLATTSSPSALPFPGLGISGNGKPAGRHFIRFAADEQSVQIAADSLKSD